MASARARRLGHRPRGTRAARNLIDATVPLGPETAVYEGDPRFQLARTCGVDPVDPDSYETASIFMGTHTGTHVDAPRHFYPSGLDIGSIPVAVLCGLARVVDLRGQGTCISARALEQAVAHRDTRLLLRTDQESRHGLPFSRDFVHLGRDAARWIKHETRVQLLGVDSFSVDSWPDPWPGFGFPVHRALLSEPGPVVLVERLDLREASAGEYELFCLPLRLVGADAAPARVLLRPWMDQEHSCRG